MKRTTHPINDLPLMEQFRSYRKGMGFKQYTVAVTSNTSREAYLRAEGGRADPRLSSLVAWAEALGCRLVLEPITSEAVTAAMNIAMRYRQFGGVGVQADPQGVQPTLKECSTRVGVPPIGLHGTPQEVGTLTDDLPTENADHRWP